MERLSELNALLNMDEKGNETIMADEDIGREGSSTDSRDAVEEKELPETADRIHKPSILERLKQEKAQQNTAEQPPAVSYTHLDVYKRQRCPFSVGGFYEG